MSGAASSACCASSRWASPCPGYGSSCVPPPARASTTSTPVINHNTDETYLAFNSALPVQASLPLAFTVSCTSVVQTSFAGTIHAFEWAGADVDVVQYWIAVSLAANPAVISPIPSPVQSLSLSGLAGEFVDFDVPINATNSLPLSPGVYYATLYMAAPGIGAVGGPTALNLQFDGVLTATVISAV